MQGIENHHFLMDKETLMHIWKGSKCGWLIKGVKDVIIVAMRTSFSDMIYLSKFEISHCINNLLVQYHTVQYENTRVQISSK